MTHGSWIDPTCAGAVRLLAAAVLATLAGCGAFRDPYALDVHSMDDTSKASMASIRLSPPQVFTREQLINDRLTESAFLSKQLGRTESEALGNSLSRDLQVVTALSAQLSLSFDPAQRINFRNQSQQADLQQQIDTTQLQTQLVSLKQQLAALQAATVAPASASAASGAFSASTTVTSGGSTASSDARIVALAARIDSALTAIQAMGGATPRPNTITGTLEDDFEDRYALRARIREAINTNALDDSHDIDGNALYHLQFNATILPGENKKQFGIVRLQLTPGELWQNDIDTTYYTWLSSITNRLNQQLNDAHDAPKAALSYLTIGPMTGLYDIWDLPLTLQGSNKVIRLSLAVRPGQSDTFLMQAAWKKSFDAVQEKLATHAGLALKLYETIESKGDCKATAEVCSLIVKAPEMRSTRLKAEIAAAREALEVQALMTRHPSSAEAYAAFLHLKKTAVELPELSSSELISYFEDPRQAGELRGDLKQYVGFASSVESAVFALGDRSLVNEDVKAAAVVELQAYLRGLSNARAVLDALRQACIDTKWEESKKVVMARLNPLKSCAAGCADKDSSVQGVAPTREQIDAEADDRCKDYSWSFASRAPQAFSNELRRQSGQGTVSRLADDAQPAWVAYPYSVDPMQRSQRISTVASAANALELAVAASAQLPQAGASLGAGLDYSRRASGRVDALERVPLVIGFSGTSSVAAEKGAGLNGGAAREDYEFGWIFGPQIEADPKGSRLDPVQRARTVPVSADISVPAWWPRARLGVRVSWKGKFDGEDSLVPEEPSSEKHKTYATYELPVRFRPNPSAYDALTVYLSRRLSLQGYHQARIEEVRPKVLPVCTDAANKSVTLLIYGVDLWRNPRVYLGGQLVPSDQVAVLPDMSGIWANVDTSTLSKAALGADRALVVWTAHGAAEYPLGVQVSGTCESDAVAHSRALSSFVTRAEPARISACDKTAVFAISGEKLMQGPGSYYLNGVASTASGFRSIQGRNAALVQFDNLGTWAKGLDSVALTMVTPDGVSSVDIQVGAATCGDAKPPKPAEPPPPFKFTKSIDALQVNRPEELHTVRIGVGFPADSKPTTITVTATNGEITAAQSTDPLSGDLKLQFVGGAIKLAKSTDTGKDPGTPVSIDVTVRNLAAGKSLTFAASAKPAPKAKGSVKSLAIDIDGPPAAVAAAKP